MTTHVARVTLASTIVLLWCFTSVAVAATVASQAPPRLTPTTFPPRSGDAQSLHSWIDNAADAGAPPATPKLLQADAWRLRNEFVEQVKHRRLRQSNANGSIACPQRVATAADPPKFIFLGGGMAAGKTTAVATLFNSSWWSQHGACCVIINADDFKPADLRLSTLSDAHQFSTQSAEELLVAALNEGRDIVFDSTMMWSPFVTQVIHMVRNSHRSFYGNGPGYVPEKGIEEYFVVKGDRDVPKLRYRIQLIGVFVDPALAVSRASVRQLESGRGVPIRQQLRSFKMFAAAFDLYAASVDEAVLYDNNRWADLKRGEMPTVAARKVLGGVLAVVNATSYQDFVTQRVLNE